MMWIACVIAFDEEGMIEGCLDSLAGKVARCVVVDGAYADFPHQHPDGCSTDRTVEIALDYGAGVIMPPPGCWPDECIKRTACLVGEEGDYYLFIDADERLVGELPDGLTAPAYMIGLRRDAPHALPYPIPRVVRHHESLEVSPGHWVYRVDGVRVNDPLECAVMAGCHLVHLQSKRSEARTKLKQVYYGKLWVTEAKARGRYR